MLDSVERALGLWDRTVLCQSKSAVASSISRSPLRLAKEMTQTKCQKEKMTQKKNQSNQKIQKAKGQKTSKVAKARYIKRVSQRLLPRPANRGVNKIYNISTSSKMTFALLCLSSLGFLLAQT